jgi:inner membrane protein
MSTNETEQPMSDFKKFMRSHTARIIIVGFITLVLLVPLSQISWLIRERKDRQDQVQEELKMEWGNELKYYGLVLKVPFKTGDKKEKTKLLYLYPESCKDDISTSVNERYRGIFKANLYSASIHSSSIFDLSKIMNQSKYKQADWSQAKVVMVTASGSRFRELSGFTVDGKFVQLGEQKESSYGRITESSSDIFTINPGLKPKIEVVSNAVIDGCNEIRYRPFATKSQMNLKSNWINPSFSGTSLPDNGSFLLTNNGFTAKWNNMVSLGKASSFSVGNIVLRNRPYSEIKFITMVDQYQLNERTIKYGILVLTLTFAVFFLIQIMQKMSIHPLHYFMIGLALLLFYSLLLSLSEHFGFNRAYICSATAIMLLIGWYAKSILNSLKFAIISGLSIGILYTFLLVIVNLEIYAMLVGSIGLFFVLAAIMSITRKMNFENM